MSHAATLLTLGRVARRARRVSVFRCRGYQSLLPNPARCFHAPQAQFNKLMDSGEKLGRNLDQETVMRDAFALFDRDGDGKISRKDMVRRSKKYLSCPVKFKSARLPYRACRIDENGIELWPLSGEILGAAFALISCGNGTCTSGSFLAVSRKGAGTRSRKDRWWSPP